MIGFASWREPLLVPVLVSPTTFLFEATNKLPLFQSQTCQNIDQVNGWRGSKTLVADGRCLDIDVYHPERESIIIASWFVIFNLDDWHAFFGNDQEIRRLHL